MTAFYNEINPEAAAWLRSLIAAGQIAPGVVDERSIEDVCPNELAGFTQCHFFAGVGIWSLALRTAGVPDDTPLWTGSCPCQPFSAAGKGDGMDDERHLWPDWFHLISQCRPVRIFGEQVASKDTGPWIDLVHDDLETMGYAVGAVPFPSAGVGAPHIRDRLYWAASAGVTLGDTGSKGLEGYGWHGHHGNESRWVEAIEAGSVATTSSVSRVANTKSSGRREECQDAGRSLVGSGAQRLTAGPEHGGSVDRPGPVNGYWAASDWLHCRDGKWRPVEPGTFPLAYGLPRSMGALSPELQRLAEVAGLSRASLKGAKAYRIDGLKGYGNAINTIAAQAFIESTFEAVNTINALRKAA